MLARDGDEQRAALDVAVTQFLVRSSDSVDLTEPRGPSHPAVRRVSEMLDDAIEQKMPLEEVGRAIRLNHRYVISLFKTAVGIPPHRYVMARRVERARRLLNDGEPLHAAAAASGFNDQSHLTRDFKRTFGVTPGAYQARHTHMNFLQNFPTAVL